MILCAGACSELSDSSEPIENSSSSRNQSNPAPEHEPQKETATPATTKAFNLSLPANDNKSSEKLNFEKQERLPDLFTNANSKDKKKVALGAKFLNDPSEELNYVESVNGAEIKIEIQTDQR